MKKILIAFIMICCTVISAQAQDRAYPVSDSLKSIIKAEYYFDALTNFGGGTDIPISAGTDINLGNVVINTSQLSRGFHDLFIRTENADGKWSITNHQKFYVLSEPPYSSTNTLQPIVKAEYYFDALTDFGAGTDIPIATGVNINLENVVINTSQLSRGFHNLYIRTKTADGKWSITNQQKFYVLSEPPYSATNTLQSIVKAEYYFDALTDFGTGTDIPVPTGSSLDLENVIINTSLLSEGFHRLYIRVKTADGKWSITSQKQFRVFNDPPYSAANALQPIVKAEYYFDVVTDFGAGTDIPIPTGTNTDLENVVINTSQLSRGFHNLFIRTKTADGKWSITNQQKFYVLSEPSYSAMNTLQPIVKAEYYFDNLIDFGHGTDIPITNSGTSVDLQNIIINTSGLTPGIHRLYIRTKDANGSWSISNLRLLNVTGQTPYVDFENGDYYIKPGPGNTLVPSGETLANFNYNTAPPSHAIFNDGIYFPRIDHDGNNIWVRLQHIAADPNGTGTGYNVAHSSASPFRPETFGAWWGFLYQFEIYKDGNLNGTPSYTLNGLFPTNTIVESNEILSPSEWVSLKLDNPEASNWNLNSINYTGDNTNSNPGFSAVNIPYNNFYGFSADFSGVQKELYAIDRLFDENGNYAEFRVNAANVSQFKYGFESPDLNHFQGIRLYVGTPDIPPAPANDDCANAVTLVPTTDQTFNGTTGTLTSATASGFTDCDHKATYDVWYKFTATAKYHRIVLKNADVPDNMRFQLYGGNCSAFYTIACVLNSRDSVVYDATDLRIGETYYLKVYNRSSFITPNSFDIGIVSPPLIINKGLNILTNGSFEMPAIATQSQGVGNSFNGWATRLGHPLALIREVASPIIFGPDTASNAMQSLDMFGYDDTLYQNFTIANTSTIFFSGHFSNQASQYYTNVYLPWTAFCGILDENNVLVAKSDIMNLNSKLTDKAWYQLSGTVYNLPPGNYKYIAFVSNYGTFDDAFLQTNVNCQLLSQPPTSVTTNINNNTVCSGDSITLTAEGGTLANGGTYVWYENDCTDGVLVGSGSSVTIVPSVGTHHYYVHIEESCGYTSCASVTVTVNVTPQISILSDQGQGNVMVCSGQVLTFLATTNTTGLPLHWKVNGIEVASTGAYFIFSPQNNDVVTCSVVTACGELTSNSIIVSLNILQSIPPTSVTTNDADNIICNGSSITLSANGTAMNGAEYKWYEGGCGIGGLVGTGQTITLTPTTGQHTYYVFLQENICATPCASVSITVNPAPSVSISSNFSGTICAGTNVTFNAAVTNAGIGLDYQWKLNNVNVGINSPFYMNAALSNNDVISCFVNNGCSSATSNSITMLVNLVPSSVSISLINNQTTTNCAGAYVIFEATPVNMGTTLNDKFKWKKNGVVVFTEYWYNRNFITTNLADNDVITCEMTSSVACTLPVTSNAITMTVLPVNNTSVSIALTTGSNPDCSGDPLTFTATQSNGGATPTYEWHLITGFPSSNIVVGTNSPTYTLQNPTHNDVVYCNMISSIVCSSPAIASSNSITVKAPTILSGYINCNSNCNGSPNMSTCGSATVEFYAISWNVINSVYYTNNSPGYQWKLNGNNVGTNSNTYSQTGFTDGDVITCTVTSTEPCASPSSLVLSMTVSVYDVSTASLSIYGSESVCSGSLATYYAQPVNAGSHPTYEWKLERDNVVTVVSTDYYFETSTLVNGDLITCSMQTDATCGEAVLVQSSNSLTVTVTEPVTPTIAITAANPVSSSANRFTAVVTNGGNNPTYYWKKNGIDVGNNNSSYLDFALAPGDVITCTLQSDAACANPSLVNSNSITIQSLIYCIPNTNYGFDPCSFAWIDHVVLGTTVDQSSGCGGFYSDYTATDTLKTTAGQTIAYNISEGSDGTNYGRSASMFIDYNSDGDFEDAGEKIMDNVYIDLETDITGTFIVPILIAPGSYRLRIIVDNTVTSSCTSNFDEAEDYILQVTQPDYCIPVISNPCDMWISNVTIGTINNTSTQPTNCNAGGYTDYSSVLSTNAAPGQVVNFSLTGHSNIFFEPWQMADIYIDFNNDGDFDDTDEKVVADISLYTDNLYNGSFSIPAAQPYGYYRMRVKSYNYYETQTGPCGNNTNGETEDYMLVVTCVANGSDIVIQGNNIDIADGDNSPDINDHTDFGNVSLGSGFIRTFTIKNTGTNVLNIGAVTLTDGTNNTAFSVAGQPLINMLNAGESTTFAIQFDSPAWGYGFNFNTTVHVATDNCDKKDYDFTIRATASCPAGGPDINVQGNGIDIARFDFTPDTGDNTDFGTVTSNNTLSKTFVIQNTGIADLNISGIQLFNNDNLLQFAVTTQPASTVPPGGLTSFVISFNPVSSGLRYAYVRINSNDCDESFYDFKIIGDAACPALTAEVNVKGNGIDIVDGDNTPDDADNTNFGLAALNISVSKSFVIENTGIDPLSISGITFTGSGATDFSVTTAPAATVAPGSSTAFTVQFLSTVSGLKSATMHISNSDCDEGDYDIAIRGTDGTVCTPIVEQPCSYMYINNVTIGSINNNSACSYGSGYSDYTATLSDIAAPGSTVQFSASAYGNEQKVNVYLDYNKDGDFEDSGEMVLSDLYMYPTSINATGSFVVPQTLAPGNYRIRVISQFYYQNSLTPCYTYYGEAEDYTLTVQNSIATTLNLKLFLEGSYRGNSTMDATLYNLELSTDPTATDNISVNLWDPAHTDINNYPDPDYTVTTLLHTDGTAHVQFPSAVIDHSYYIAVKHRNSIETWSKLPVMFTSNTTYDFSTGLDKAYDDAVIAPMKMLEEVIYGFYAGDINQDGGIDGQDMNVIDNEIGFFGYNISDVNGDGGTDGQDMNFVDNNSQLGLFYARPY